MLLLHKALLAAAVFTAQAKSIELVVDDEASVKEAASTAAYGLMKYYTGNNTGDVPGNVPKPYYWWVCGAMFGTLIDYWHYTGDDSYNEIVSQGLLHQVGADRDFMPENQTFDEGNDDQGFWAMTAMSAAEHVFPDPPADQPQWLALVQAVYTEYVGRWDTEFCGGGLRWQLIPWKTGWDYKNTISNGCFFNIAARLARYTEEEKYAEWAEKLWDWHEDAGLITSDHAVVDGIRIMDGTHCDDDWDPTEWSYNSGILLQGAAAMYNRTGDDKWADRVNGLLDYGLERFSDEQVVFEQHCEPHDACNVDQSTFKGYYIRWLASTITMIPEQHDRIWPVVKATAEAAAAACIGTSPDFHGHDGTACGYRWLPRGEFDGAVGIGPQMNALAAFTYTLVEKVRGPATHDNGGTSEGDPNAGRPDDEKFKRYRDITTADRVGAGILTALMVAGTIAGTIFVMLDSSNVAPGEDFTGLFQFRNWLPQHWFSWWKVGGQ